MTGTEVVTQQQRPADLVAYFEEQRPAFAAVMPPTEVDKFMRVMKNALIRDPDIAKASKQSVFLEIQKAAADGLVLDGREATLTRFKTNRRIQQGGQWVDNWVTEVVYIPMIRGLTRLVNESPEIADWHTGLVYEEEYKAERFNYQAGDNPRLDHRPIIVGERGRVVAAYSVVRLRSGGVKIEVMTHGQLAAIKNRTKSKNKKGEITGPWATDEEEMFRKTVARRHFKNLPLTGKAQEAVDRIDSLYDASPDEDGEYVIEPKPEPKAVANKRKGSAAATIEAAKPKPEPKEEKPEAEQPDDPGAGDSDIVDVDAEEIDQPGNAAPHPDDEF